MTESNLFCCSKWWGNPDLPPQAEYPMMKITEEDGTESEYPLTFICQIDCEDIAPFDREGLLPHEGMLYFLTLTAKNTLLCNHLNIRLL